MTPTRRIALTVCSLVAAVSVVVGASPADAAEEEPPPTTQPPTPPEATPPPTGGGGIDNLDSGTAPSVNAEVSVFETGDGATQVVTTGSSVFDGCSWDQVEAGDELTIGRPDIAAINLDGSRAERTRSADPPRLVSDRPSWPG